MRTIIAFIGTIALAFIAGCSDPIPAYNADTLTSMLQPAAGKAKLVVYYPYSYVWKDRIADVKADGHASCRLKSGSFILRDVSPGKQIVAVSLCNGNEISKLAVNAKAGGKYYVQVIPTDTSVAGRVAAYGIPTGTGKKTHTEGTAFTLDLMDEAYATNQLLWLKQVAPQ